MIKTPYTSRTISEPKRKIEPTGKLSDWQPGSLKLGQTRTAKTELNNFYALLIGVDRYEPNPHYKDLGGCVRDLNLVANYVQNTLNVPQNNIWTLTSLFDETYTPAAFSSAPKEIKPTYENIVKAFREITAQAQSGDRIYIHYSGYRGSAVTIYPELKGVQRQDEGLVPIDIGSPNARYLRDVELATLLKCLTDKGCIVTVIFDISHSGAATKEDCVIRSHENNFVDRTPRNQDSLVASREMLLNNWRILTQTNPELSAGWLHNASDYVLIAQSKQGKEHLIINSRKSIIQNKRGSTLKKTQLPVWLKTKILLMLK